MNKLALPSIDVVIPVYNAPVLTKRCIDSVINYLGKSIRYIHIQNDASDVDTYNMLNSLPYKQVKIYHAQKNQGFGKTVNEAISHSNACYVLVLNSDTKVTENFIPQLYAALVADPHLAVISPAHRNFARYKTSLYLRGPGGYIPAYRFKGHAFLIRRNIFQKIGGFDQIFGRGYFEDIDLSRRLDQQNWRMGVHPDTEIQHKGGGSFGRGQAYRKLMQHNRALYLARYPESCNNILLVSTNYITTDFSTALINAMQNIFRKGGNIHWLTPTPAQHLICLHMRNSPTNLLTIIRLMLRGLLRKDKRISAVWLLPGLPYLLRTWLITFSKIRQVDVLTWEPSKNKPAPPSN